jgi:hypothetical protein
VLRAHVTEPRGSKTKPMNDAELDAKFREQTNFILSSEATERLLGVLRNVTSLANVGKEVAAVWQG